MADDSRILACSIGIIFSISFFNAIGVSITKYASAAERAVVDSSRTLFIWIISLSVGWEDFLALELVGFFLLVLGALIYNEIIIIKSIEFMHTNTKREREARDKVSKGLLKGDDMPAGATSAHYVGLSPTAKYDSGRTYRNIEKKENERSKLVHDH